MPSKREHNILKVFFPQFSVHQRGLSVSCSNLTVVFREKKYGNKLWLKSMWNLWHCPQILRYTCKIISLVWLKKKPKSFTLELQQIFDKSLVMSQSASNFNRNIQQIFLSYRVSMTMRCSNQIQDTDGNWIRLCENGLAGNFSSKSN